MDMGFFIRSLVDQSYIYKKWTHFIWTNQKQPSQIYIFTLCPRKLYGIKIMNKVNFYYVN
jgi:hypothetical protein